ncbi:MAG: CpaE family protein [Candidatus Planktophila sp.]
MAELHVVTAIADPDFEGFVARTLFGQGWSVLYRALDGKSLHTFLVANHEVKPILIYSSDIAGLDSQFLQSLAPYIDRAVGFQGEVHELSGAELPKPQDAIELLSIIRSPGRAPMMRRVTSKTRRSKIVTISGSKGGDGVSIVALNLSIELTLLGKKVLLIDAHHRQPALATFLGERNINQERPRSLNSLIDLYEITEMSAPNIDEIISEYSQQVDWIVFDSGRFATFLEERLHRRWDELLQNWILQNSDHLWVLSTPAKISELSLVRIVQSLTEQEIHPKITYLLNQRDSGKKGDQQEEKFLTTVSASHPHAIRVLPSDLRGVKAAESDRSILMESNPRGALRKELMSLVRDLIASG